METILLLPIDNQGTNSVLRYSNNNGNKYFLQIHSKEVEYTYKHDGY